MTIHNVVFMSSTVGVATYSAEPSRGIASSNKEVRLINGNNNYQGTVEVFYNNRWGKVCDDGWDTNAARVTCRWLGLDSDMAIAVGLSGFQSNHSNGFLLDDLVCTGNESSLAECGHAQWGVHNCGISEEAGVICPAALFPNHDAIYLIERRLHKIIRMDLQLLTYSFIHTNSTNSPDCFDYDADNDEFYFYDDHQKKILRMKSDGNDLRLVLQLDYNTLLLQSIFSFRHFAPSVHILLQTLCSFRHFAPSVTFLLQTLCSFSPYSPSDTLLLQALCSFSPYTPSDTLLLQALCSFSPYTPSVTLLLQALCSFSPYSPSDTLLLQSIFSFRHFAPSGTLLLQSIYAFRHFAPSGTLLLQSIYAFSHFAPSGTLLLQYIYSFSHFAPFGHFAPSVTLLLQSLCSFSHFAPSGTLLLQSLCSFSHFAPSVTLLLQSIYSFSHFAPFGHFASSGTLLLQLLLNCCTFHFDSDVYSVRVDPKYGVVFYSDDGLSALRSVSLSGQILRSISCYSPRAITLNPISGIVYWSDWGFQPMIESASYDGSNRRTLISTGLKWPSSLTIDIQENRLYFVDGGTETIESIDLVSNTRRTILQETAHLLSLDLVGNDIYYTAVNRSKPYRVHKDGSNSIALGRENFSELTEIIGYKYGTNNLGQTISQPFNVTTHPVFFRIMSTLDMTSGPIEIFINGEWRSVCSLNWDDAAAQVACHMLGFDRYRAVKADYPLEGSLNMSPLSCTGQEDNIVDCHFNSQNWSLHYCSSNMKAGVVCEQALHSIDYRMDDFLIFSNSSTNTLIRMDLGSYSYTANRFTAMNNSVPMAVTFDTYNQNYYVSMVNFVNRNSTITVFDNRGNFMRYLSYIPAGSLINGLALDTRRNTLYYIDGGNHVVGSMSTYGTDQKILATSVAQPGGIALDKRHLFVYWTEGGASPKVVKMNHNGTNQQVIASSGLNDPRGIAVDPAANLVYFCNSGQRTIEVMDTDGRNRRVLFTDQLSQLQGLTITSKYIFYTDLNGRKIKRLNRDGTNSTSVGTDDFPGVYDIDAYESTFSY
ncbi:hypothetical protein Btru_050143 [Bulinus truncatus]|nr:hypothetical protein Btru_050143 [Bulinus truncatus]